MVDEPSPLYTPRTLSEPAYHLRYAWTGWPSEGTQFPDFPPSSLWESLTEAWETDGIRYLESNWAPHRIQITCSVRPTVGPVFFTGRVKGRLQHAMRMAGQPAKFSRKVAFRSLGENNRKTVELYIGNQVANAGFVDPRFAQLLDRFTKINEFVDLRRPASSLSGRYWYNLHLVLVTEERMRFTDEPSLAKLFQLCNRIAEKKGYRVSACSVMPDHVHVALGGDIERSPEEIALSYMNNLAYGFGQRPIWRPSYYVGSFGEYDMGAVRDIRG